MHGIDRSKNARPRIRARVAALAAGLLASFACASEMEVSTQTSVVKVLECMRANTPRTLSISELHIEAQGTGVTTRALTAAFYSRRDERGLRATLQVTAQPRPAHRRRASLRPRSWMHAGCSRTTPSFE